MKKKIHYTLLAVLISVGTLTSCSKFLDQEPEGKPTADNYFNNDFQARSIVDGIFARFHQEQIFGRNLFFEQGAANDVVWGRSTSSSTLCTFEYTGDEGRITSIYEHLNTSIARANYAISSLLNKEKSTSLSPIERRSLGEAYFGRAFAHFYIAYRYGTDQQGVPISRFEDMPDGYDNSIPVQQASVVDNYRLIIEDLDQALKYLPRFEEYDVEDKGRPHQAAAIGYKAKVNAYWATWDKSRWSEVIKLVDQLERDYGRGLADTFDQLFSSDFKDFWNREYIWTIPGNGGVLGGGSKFPGVVLENKGWSKYNGWGYFKPTLDIYEEMLKDGEGNERLVRSILEYNQEFEFFGEPRRFYSSSDLESGFQINKYMDAFKYKDPTGSGHLNPNGNFMTTRINFPILRFAELLLFRAEAYLMQGNVAEATKDINRIRRRSNLKPLSGNATMEALYHERRCELAFEFTDHLFDLKRWHRSDNPELKAIAAKELNARPRVRKYADRGDALSSYTIGYYDDYKDKATYSDHMMVFPYPSIVIVNSGGLLKQNPGY